MIHESQFHGLPVQSGDILCTHDGVDGSLFGAVWALIGRVIPGEVDHCLIYIGPGGRCIESGVRGVITFEMPGDMWEAKPLARERELVDELVGVAYPLAGRGLARRDEERIRTGVVDFCLAMAAENRPYSFDFLNLQDTRGFYCSQLVHKAYHQFGIELNTNRGVPDDPLLGRIVFPEEVWDACVHRRVAGRDGARAAVPHEESPA